MADEHKQIPSPRENALVNLDYPSKWRKVYSKTFFSPLSLSDSLSRKASWKMKNTRNKFRVPVYNNLTDKYMTPGHKC